MWDRTCSKWCSSNTLHLIRKNENTFPHVTPVGSVERFLLSLLCKYTPVCICIFSAVSTEKNQASAILDHANDSLFTDLCGVWFSWLNFLYFGLPVGSTVSDHNSKTTNLLVKKVQKGKKASPYKHDVIISKIHFSVYLDNICLLYMLEK